MGQLTPDGARAVISCACPNCGSRRTRVICSKPTDDGTATVRRRHCEACLRRWYSIQPPEQLLMDWQVRWVSSHKASRADRVRVTPAA